MLKFPPELIVQKGNVFYFLYVVGGLLMGVTAGGQCLDVAVRTAQNPKNLLRLSNTLIGLLGLRYQTRVTTLTKQNLKRLYFSESFRSLLCKRRILLLSDTCDFHFLSGFPVKQTNLESTSKNWISTKRCRVHYVLFCGSSQIVLALCIRGRGRKMKIYRSSNQLQWLISFSRQVQGDVIFLLLDGLNGKAKPGSDTNDATNHPTRLTLGLSALSVLLLWTFLPHFALCAMICLALSVQRH